MARAELEKAEAVHGPPLKLASPMALRGLALAQVCPPGPPPIGIAPIPMGVDPPTLLGPCADTTSSSSAASAEDPRMPFGLGDRRLGDPDPELLASPLPATGPPPATGRAIGAIGRVIGPGPETSLLPPCTCKFNTGAEARRPCPGASREGPEAEVEVVLCAEGFATFAGGPIGEGGTALPLLMGTPTPMGIPRLKAGSKEDPPLKPRGSTEGLNGVPGGG